MSARRPGLVGQVGSVNWGQRGDLKTTGLFQSSKNYDVGLGSAYETTIRQNSVFGIRDPDSTLERKRPYFFESRCSHMVAFIVRISNTSTLHQTPLTEDASAVMGRKGWTEHLWRSRGPGARSCVRVRGFGGGRVVFPRHVCVLL